MTAEPSDVLAEGPEIPNGPVSPISRNVANDLVGGTSALAAGVFIERGFGFIANLLAARLGGTATFGSYSLAITTANNISTYAAGGIGSTAVRFSGQYGREKAEYETLARALLIISSVSAVAAALALVAGSRPIADLLKQPRLTGLLQWAALSAAGMILLECCRGFLVGQRRIRAILLLSTVVGLGMILFIPAMARWGAIPMIVSQGCVSVAAVLLCVVFYRHLGLAPQGSHRAHAPLGPMLRQVWSFGLVQLAGLVGLNAAGWWLTSLVARADITMAQIGFFAIASQLRNMASLVPSLVTESSLAVMARPESATESTTPDAVMAACTFAIGFVSLLTGGLGMIVVPQVLPLLYGKAYSPAAEATCLGLATAIVHMGTGPASARLSIVSIRLTGVINTVWAIVVAALATTFFFWRGSAAKGMAIYLAAHVLSTALVLAALATRGKVLKGVRALYAVGAVGVAAMVSLSLLRIRYPDSALALNAAMLTALLLCLRFWFQVGQHHRWAPSLSQIWRILENRLPLQVKSMLGR